MTTYIVHLYREMKLSYTGIEAHTPEVAAAIASGRATADADTIEDCEGENLAALVDTAGDENYGQSVTIDFEGERIRKAAARLLSALEGALYALDENRDGSGPPKQTAIDNALAAIVTAKAAGIPPDSEPARLLAALESLLPYAENEAFSLEKLKDSPEAEAEKVWLAVEAAQDAMTQARASGIAPADIDVHAHLAARREIAAIWGIEDVQENRPDLSDSQAWEVLEASRRYHDANIGINWDVLDCHADMLFGPAPETEETEEA